MKKTSLILVCSLVLLSSSLSAWAQDFYVIPVLQKLKNIVTVAKAGGNFTAPVAAVDSITDASETNPYLVVIAPGVYTISQTLQMKEYVDIAGSGENVTRVTGAISTDEFNATSAVISGANNSALSSLTVENTGGGTYCFALYNGGASPKVTHVAASASGATYNRGVFNYSSSPTITDVTASASGGTYGYGVYNYSSSPTMTDVTASASGGTYGYGVYNGYSSPTMTDVTTSASGATYNRGVYNGYSSPTMTDVTASASGGTQSYGVYNVYSSPKIRRTTMTGGYGLHTSGTGSTQASQSTIIGGVSGTATCVYCDNGSGVALNANCTSP